jgi:hypothetical protein
MLQKLRAILFQIRSRGAGSRGQSFLELALVLPILLLILMGLVEISIFIGRYLDVLDLTREAARFASVRDPFDTNAPVDFNCSTVDRFSFYYDTACIMSPLQTQACLDADDPFCNGLNAYLNLNPETDDVVISVFTVEGANIVSDTHPKSGDGASSATDEGGQTTHFWALSDTSWGGGPGTENWSKDCEGETARTHPYFTQTHVQDVVRPSGSGTLRPTAPPSKGYVAVEIYFCHDQALALPVFTIFVPNPLMIHAYTIMPIPAAAPTPTPQTP